MKLYGYFRSSASWRVRIALNLKGLPHETVAIHLLNDGGQQLSDAYRAINPDRLVPALAIDEGDVAAVSATSAAAASAIAPLSQSLAIIEYLDEVHPAPPLLPGSALDRAWVRAIALAIACDIHPLNNLRVLRYLDGELQFGNDARDAWYRHWCEQGLAALEARLAADARTGRFCFGDAPTLADCCLVPQLWNAQRFHCDLSALPTLLRINDACLALDAFASAAPALQLDAG